MPVWDGHSCPSPLTLTCLSCPIQPPQSLHNAPTQSIDRTGPVRSCFGIPVRAPRRKWCRVSSHQFSMYVHTCALCDAESVPPPPSPPAASLERCTTNPTAKRRWQSSRSLSPSTIGRTYVAGIRSRPRPSLGRFHLYPQEPSLVLHHHVVSSRLPPRLRHIKTHPRSHRHKQQLHPLPPLLVIRKKLLTLPPQRFPLD